MQDHEHEQQLAGKENVHLHREVAALQDQLHCSKLERERLLQQNAGLQHNNDALTSKLAAVRIYRSHH